MVAGALAVDGPGDSKRRTMTDDSLIARDARFCWHPYTQHGADDRPLAVRAASGAWLELEDGRRILDAISSWWTILHGHAEPALIETMHAQASTLDHVLFAGATHDPAVRLAERLVEHTPTSLQRVFFSDDGSTAIEVALKIALQAHHQRGERQRQVFITFDGAYHGDTFGAMSVGDPDPFFEPYAGQLFRVERIPLSLDGLSAALERLGDTAAGILVEPRVQGAGGMLMHGADVLLAMQGMARAAGIPFILDEVMTGFGRTGSIFASIGAGLQPDIQCVAKGITGGIMPLAVTLASETLFDAFRSDDRSKMLFHGHSFTAHPIACAVANRSLDLVLERDVPGRLDRIGTRIEDILTADLRTDHARATLRRTGGIVAFDLDLEPGYLGGAAREGRRIALDHDVLLRPLGPVLYAMPPACTSDDEAERIAEVLLVMERELTGS